MKPQRSFLDGRRDSFKKGKTENEEAREEKEEKQADVPNLLTLLMPSMMAA